MALRFFDTLRQEKVDFQPIEEGKIGIYVCGVTVYDMCHIGHARCYVAFDTIIRFLRYLDYEVRFVRNFTDVDDKIIKRANEINQPIDEITNRFISEFQTDMDSLDVAQADVEPRVTTHIQEIITMVSDLIERGYAYANEGDVYFSVESFDEYGALSKRNLDDLRAGASERTGDAELARKRSPLDFALWKSSKEGDPAWSSPWGEGRPGWHIECSAMSCKYLGETFDIHAGGQDLVFPHHENEIAQSRCANGGEFSRYWLHNGFVNIDQEKMSKSLGNFFTIRDVLELFHPQAVRFFLLTTHYRGPINYSDQNLRDATRRVYAIYATLERMDQYLEARAEKHKGGDVLDPELVKSIVSEFNDSMSDDFNTPKAIAVLSEPIRRANELLAGKEIGGRYATIKALREAISVVTGVLRVFHQDPATVLSAIGDRIMRERGISAEDIVAKIEERKAAREARDFALADSIRDTLNEQGVLLMDGATGTGWRVQP